MLAELTRSAARSAKLANSACFVRGHRRQRQRRDYGRGALSSLGKLPEPNEILFTETGTSSMGLAFALMPKGATFHNQTLWGSIGWATPAAFGAAVAGRDRRLVLVTGDGSHQLTAQEISQFGRRGLKPVVFLLNN